MTEHEWEELRATLAREFGDDLAQESILDLLETQAKGTAVLNPLHWCRKVAKRRKINQAKRNRFDLTEDMHKLVEKSQLPGLQEPASQLELIAAGDRPADDEPGRRPLSMTSAAVRKRRSRRKLRPAKVAA